MGVGICQCAMNKKRRTLSNKEIIKKDIINNNNRTEYNNYNNNYNKNNNNNINNNYNNNNNNNDNNSINKYDSVFYNNIINNIDNCNDIFINNNISNQYEDEEEYENIMILEKRCEDEIEELNKNYDNMIKEVIYSEDLKNDMNDELNENISKIKDYYNKMIKAIKFLEKKNKEIEEKEKENNNDNNNNNDNIPLNIEYSNELPSYTEIQYYNNNKNKISMNYDKNNILPSYILPSYNEVYRNNGNNNKNEYKDINDYIKIIDYKKEDNMKFKEKECLFCLNKYENGMQLCILECQHTFHELCFRVWVNKIKDIFCPLCQADVD